MSDRSQEHIVILTGAGISAESGLSTFRDNGGLWEEYSVYDVATPEAFERDPELVLRFYNMRRRQLQDAKPNDAHHLLAELEDRYRVTVVTQNVDDLHERGTQLRPHVVWFGEEVPMLAAAADVVAKADRLLIVGTSLQVYPAAGLVHEVNPGVPITVIDPGEPASVTGAEVIRKGASEGLREFVSSLP
ncbi:NAD-dependent deacetylase [Marinobacter persicus]|uniref:protein acetyllysine N-acetyltransferase n=1 Tax=Marinobacter persicus TaxID=930118 RepID=A0A1I3PVD1_9GAMM|nr:Sir2 family NAD-dependent protein deacetylase [Marinobacter persicus]GHD52031.1 NAD-dependent protein deacylase [Marinobacter persicus]SFJ25419.1 NAD-dependent deacetylase [Marinobacter persicus]